MEDLEDWEQRLHAILGDKSERSLKNARRYLSHLKGILKFPLTVTGREDFPWEEPYVLGGWSKAEYNRLKKTQPSFTDTFELLELLDPEELDPDEHEDVAARVRRVSDGREFRIGLSWLTCKKKKTPEFLLLDDYATWHTNY